MIKKRIECEKCEGVSVIEHEMEHHFYEIKFCPFCGEELELEEEYTVNDVYEEEYEANN
jgi:hypothetical protein|tara:strand:- start:1015 stop:1191 length:177 start_codon:yes stop_codon:yes gene_type:complete